MNASLRSVRQRRTIRYYFAWLCVACFCLLFLLTFFWPKTRAHLQSFAILTQLNGHSVPWLLRPIAALPLATQAVTIPSSAGAVSARLYTPVSRPGAPGVVVVPGIHYLGMNEPRLTAFARSMAACGLLVLTPELPDSRDYRIRPTDVQAIGDAVQWLKRKSGRPVGLMGLSFSGGLALMAAARPEFADDVSFVFSVGGHDDLSRVANFYVTGAIPLPGGDVERKTPNNYGPWILEYENLQDFTLPVDTAAIRPVFRARLYNDPKLEKHLFKKLTHAQRVEYARVLDIPHQRWAIAVSNKKHAAEMAAVSPHGLLATLRTRVFLLHGLDDTLIPSAESEWLAQDLPKGVPTRLLISPLIGHVGITPGEAGWIDRWQLLHLLALVMQNAANA